ncbi:MAG: IS4/IS5 family transposase [Sphingobacteriales bacterium]|uniref:transposase n=1 Tax=Hydrotalea flava TaxID=714549 RepID=UPI00082B0327|nr:transposase [Hydrotalea flava]RTL53187.1 MAG: IS4/IS5 family transposase [Sphingobacteriales bacterium]
MIAEAQKICISSTDFNLSIKGNVYVFDSTTIDLWLNVFCWATFRRAKGAVKLHTLLDIKTAIHIFMHITPASVHDVNGLDFLTFETGRYYIIDCGYIGFNRLSTIDKDDVFFVIRAKANLKFTRVSSEKPDKANGVLCDQRMLLQMRLKLKPISPSLLIQL